MKNKLIPIFLFFFLMIVLLLVLRLSNGNKNDLSGNSVDKITQKTQTNDGVANTLKDLLGLGKTQKCVFSTKTEAIDMKGTVYTKGKITRMEAEYKIPGMDGFIQKMNTINDGDWIYTWNPDTNTGMKIKMSATDDSNQVTPQAQGSNNSVDYNQKMDFNCGAWAGDNALLTPPTNVEFTDFSQYMDTVPALPNN